MNWTNEQRLLSRVLIDAWERAESAEDDEAVERIKLALKVLGLPWVRLAADPPLAEGGYRA